MAFTENLADFINDDTPGYVLATVGGVACAGIFDNAFALTLSYVSGTAPSLVVKTADVPAVAQGDAVTIGTTGYTVEGVEADGAGITLLRLGLA